jgi:transcriptional regulator with XRE-family HTH domain
MDGVDARIAKRLKGWRQARGLTLDQLADRSQVSRAMISRIERGDSSPTATLLGRLCAGLGVTLSLLRATDQPVWRDPETGFLRRAVSPTGIGVPVDIVESTLLPGTSLGYPPSPWAAQHVLGQAGELTVTLGDGEAMDTLVIGPGDCAHYRLDRSTTLNNRGLVPCRYLVILYRREASLP